MKRALLVLGLFAAAVAANACTITSTDTPDNDGGASSSSSGDTGASSSGSSSGGTSSSSGGSADRGEWTDYTPAEINGNESGEFASAQDTKSFNLAATDVGGGLLKVTVSPHNVEVGVWLAEGEKADEQRWEGNYMDPAQTSGTFFVRLHGGKSYQLRAYPLNFSEDEPNPYTVKWEYEPLIDGYEPNETRELAKRIPLDKAIQAYAHAGIGPNDSRLVGSVADDWYKFELTADKTVKLKFDRGAEHTSYLAVLDSAGNAVSCADTNFSMGVGTSEPGTQFETCEGPLTAGTYFVHHGIGNSEDPGTSTGEAVPAHFRAKYTLTVETK